MSLFCRLCNFRCFEFRQVEAMWAACVLRVSCLVFIEFDASFALFLPLLLLFFRLMAVMVFTTCLLARFGPWKWIIVRFVQ
jgi:hypothetical protein